MIDIENYVFDTVYRAIIKEYPTIHILSRPDGQVGKFPAVYLSETDNAVARKYQTQRLEDDYVDILYECQVFSNKEKNARAETKHIMTLINNAMVEMGFVRLSNRPLQNVMDTTIARRVARWRATTDGKTIYRG